MLSRGARMAGRIFFAVAAAAAAAGIAVSVAIGAVVPLLMVDAVFGVLFAAESAVAHRFAARGVRRRSGRRLWLPILWGLSFPLWSVLVYRAVAAALIPLGTRVSRGPRHAHVDLVTHIEAGLVFAGAVAVAGLCSAGVLVAWSGRSALVRPVAAATALAAAIGGVGVAIGWPDRLLVIGASACTAALVWHTLVGHQVLHATQADGPRRGGDEPA